MMEVRAFDGVSPEGLSNSIRRRYWAAYQTGDQQAKAKSPGFGYTDQAHAIQAL